MTSGAGSPSGTGEVGGRDVSNGGPEHWMLGSVLFLSLALFSRSFVTFVGGERVQAVFELLGERRVEQEPCKGATGDAPCSFMKKGR